jgi:hypothetical protein
MARVIPLLLLVLGLAAPAGAQPITERIGAWLLTCVTDRINDRTDCRLQHRDEVFDGLLLEIAERDGRLLPVLRAQRLGPDAAGELLASTAQMRFPPQPMLEMPCGAFPDGWVFPALGWVQNMGLLCAPRPEDSELIAANLPRTRLLLVRLAGRHRGQLRDGFFPDAEPIELRMDGIDQALGRFRSHLARGARSPLSDVVRRLQDLF